MVVKVIFYNTLAGFYSGREYTYRTALPLKAMDKVMAPVGIGGLKRALVMEVDVDVKEITLYDDGTVDVKEITLYDDGTVAEREQVRND